MVVPGLLEALTAAGLEGHASAANDWCVSVGARDLEELVDDEVFDMLASELNLKLLEKKRLKKELGAGRAPAANLTKAPSLTTVSGAPTSTTVFVKNTFLDLEDGPRMETLRRLNTEPAPAVAGLDEQEEEEDAEEPGDLPATAQEEAGAQASRSPLEGLYKTATYDGYESWDEWNWLSAGGDPNNQGEGLEGGMATVPETAVYDAPLDASFGGPVGMVMVPSDMVHPAVMMPCLPGCTLVPMDRFARWPIGMPDDGSWMAPERNEREHALQRAFSVASRINRIRWTVDARKLKSKDREAASPTFELSGLPMEFKMVIRPRKVQDCAARGGASFKAAQGKGTVQLRVLSQVETSCVVTFRLAVGSLTKQADPRGPVRHDFAEKPICGLPEGRDEWDFQKVVDKQTQTFVVCLEVMGNVD